MKHRMERGDISEADYRKMHNKAVKLHEQGNKLVEKGKDTRARKRYQQALDLACRIDDVELKAHALCSLAQTIARQRDFVTAFSYMEESIAILEELQSPDLPMFHEIYEDVKQLRTQDMFDYILQDAKLQNMVQQLVKRQSK